MAAGQWLRAAYPRIDDVIVSPALRARQTWALVSRHVAAPSVREDARIYDDWGARLLGVVAEVPSEARSAMIVGHNPGVEECALTLARGGDAQGIARLRQKYPTSAIAVVHLPGTWAEAGVSLLAAFAVPRG